MDTMDLKGIAWVGNIYQKFEAMCLEVEETMCQETAKYVENQVQTVGASMKRFCSDVMQDLLPPSSKDLSKVASADLLLNPYLEYGIYKKPLSSIKDDAKDLVCIKGISEDKKSTSSNDAWVDWSAASFDWEISDKDEANCVQMAMKASNEAIECESRIGQEGKTCNMKGKRSKPVSSSNIIRSEHTDADTCESIGLVPQMGSQASLNASSGRSIDGDVSHTDSSEKNGLVSISQTGSHINANTLCGQSAGEEVFCSHTGNLGDDDPELEMEEFEDTCVFVEGNDYHPINHKEETHSYKKKIQKAFCLKKKLERKQEYKQLAAQHGKRSIKGEEAVLKANKVSDVDLLESQWELL